MYYMCLSCTKDYADAVVLFSFTVVQMRTNNPRSHFSVSFNGLDFPRSDYIINSNVFFLKQCVTV